MFTWPENILPLPSHDFDVQADFSNARSKMDSGRIRQRPRYTKELELSSVRFDLDKPQYSFFKAVWVHEISQGTDWFTMRLPLADGETLTLSEVRFNSDYVAKHRASENWDISATIEYRDPASISENALAVHIIYGEDPQQFQDEVAQLQTIFPKDWEL